VTIIDKGDYLVSKIIVEIVENPEKEHGCWGIQVSNEGGDLFFDTGYIYEGQGAADRAFCKLLDSLPKKKS
jgi:hypothetical protein